MTLLLALCGFAYAVHIYWGVGDANNINVNDLTKSFDTNSSEDNMQEQEEKISYVKSEIINSYVDVYADNSVCVEINDNNISSIYFSPAYMVIFTQANENGWVLSKGEALSINFSLYDKQSIELEVGYVLDGEYHTLYSALGSDFSDTISAPKDGTYYFCVTNKSSSNAVMKGGTIGVVESAKEN